VTASFYDAIQPVADFSQVVDQSAYSAVPDDWWVGVTDVVQSTAAIAEGRYKAVNLAGAAAISAVLNALNQASFPFAFCGDGAQFAIPGDTVPVAHAAMQRTAAWVRDELGLELRVALVAVRDIRAAGFDVSVARYSTSAAVDYAMFTGGGMNWVEKELKAGRLGLEPVVDDGQPDLTGLSCQWGAVRSRNGEILSIIARPEGAVPSAAYVETIKRLLAALNKEDRISPVPAQGPDLSWPKGSVDLMSRLKRGTASLIAQRVRVFVQTVLLWLLFRFRLRVGGFDPAHYRRMVSANTDFQKYGDGLYLTVDCSAAVAQEIEALLTSAAANGALTYGLHRQQEALLTCIVPSVATDSHLHLLDGAGGGYAAAAAQFR
jgi:hypothetical protein